MTKIPQEIVAQAVDNLLPRIQNMPAGKKMLGMVDAEIRRLMHERKPGVKVSDKDISRAIDEMRKQHPMGPEAGGGTKAMTRRVLHYDAAPGITLGEVQQSWDLVQSHFVVIHRVNYVLHETMVTVFDLLERDGHLRFGVKKLASDVERMWTESIRPRQMAVERSAWCTFQDHLRLAYDAVEPRLEKVYEAVRNYMIRLAWRDVELKARCSVALLMGKMVGVSFRHFFDDWKKETRIDFTRAFQDDNLQPMVKAFARLCDSVGLRTGIDGDGYYMPTDIDLKANQRVVWAWDDFMLLLRDDDLMDDTARHAIDLNPVVRENYREAMEEAEREQEEQKQAEMQEAFKQLEEKYKVTKK